MDGVGCVVFLRVCGFCGRRQKVKEKEQEEETT